MSAEWTVVIPVKGTASAKSRLGASAGLAMAIALDTIAAAAAAPGVAHVIVVTASPSSFVRPVVQDIPVVQDAPVVQDIRVVQDAADGLTTPGQDVLHNGGARGLQGSIVTVVQDIGSGLNAAIRDVLHNTDVLQYTDALHNSDVLHNDGAGAGAVAVMLGDLPALLPEELGDALAEAERHPLAMVPDADGSGTTLITALRGADHAPAFGAGSKTAHLARGYVELDVPASSGLRRDVDTEEQLRELGVRLGPRTVSAISRRQPRAAGA